MRLMFALACLFLCAAAPPAPLSHTALAKLIDRLGDDDYASAASALEGEGESVLPALRTAMSSHVDPDVRLRATLLVSAIKRARDPDERTFTGHTEGVIVLAISPDGQRIVSGSGEGNGDTAARIWETATGDQLLALQGHTGGILGVAWSADGKRILTGSGDMSLILWDSNTGKALRTLTGHTGALYHVTLTPDGKKAVSCADDKSVRIWDLETGKQIASNTDWGDRVRGVTMMPDGKHVACACLDGEVRLIDLAGKSVRKMERGHGCAWFVAASPDGKLLASCGANKVVILWDSATGKELKRFLGHTDTVHSVRFSPDGKQLLTAGHDHTARLWDVATAKEVQKLEGHTQVVTSAAFLPSGRHVVTASYDRSLRLWKIGK